MPEKKQMTKEEFEKWCNNYGIFHFLNVENSAFCSFHVLENPHTAELDKTFLGKQLTTMGREYSNVNIWWGEVRQNEHVVIINF